MKGSKFLMHISAIIAIVLWALAYILIRISLQHFTPEASAFLRYLTAAVSLLIYALIKKMRLPKLRDIPLFIFGGAAGFALYVYFINTGSTTLTASVVSFIVSSSPVLTALLARFFLKEKIGFLGWASVLCAFSGIAVITYYNGGFTFSSGLIWICLAAILLAVYNIFQRKMLSRYTPLEITTYCIIAGALLLSVFAPGSFPLLMTANLTQILSIIILGIFSSSIAYLAWAYALNFAEKTSEVTNYMFVTPIITTFLGFIMINEAPHVSVYVGGAMVLAGVLLINKRNAHKNKSLLNNR